MEADKKTIHADFYPRSPCGERPKPEFSPIKPVCISIHALLAESDHAVKPVFVVFQISIHALLAESDDTHHFPTLHNILISIHALLAESDHIYTHPVSVTSGFLSTLSLRRATGELKQRRGHPENFYPRSPCGERRESGPTAYWGVTISIHALLAESDPLIAIRYAP